MARTVRKPSPPTLVLGVFGQGESPIDNMADLLDDYFDGLGEVTPKFVFPITKEDTTETIQDLVGYCEQNNYAYEGLFLEPFGRTKALKAIGDGAVKTTKVDDLGEALAERLGSANEARLLFLWAEDTDGEPNEYDQQVLWAVMDKGVIALDLTGGLEPIPAEEDDGETPANAPDDGGEDEYGAPVGPDYDEVSTWPVKRVRSYALDDELHGEDVLTPDEANGMTKDELLAYFFPEDAPDEVAEEPEPEPKAPRARARKAAAEVEEPEAEETKPTRGEARVRAQKAKDEALAADALDRLSGNDEAQAGPFEAVLMEGLAFDWDEVGNKIADIIIDRIAARVEGEPMESEFRKEIAPARPPGRPRADGKAPVRRTAARTR